MASNVYPKWKNKLLQNDADSALNSAEGATGVYVALVNTAVYTYDTAHDFYNDITGVLADEVEILTKTQVDSTFDGDDVTFTAVANTGVTGNALVLYRKNAGANTTWPVIVFLDDGDVTNLPVTPNGGDITVAWNASGIFTL